MLRIGSREKMRSRFWIVLRFRGGIESCRTCSLDTVIQWPIDLQSRVLAVICGIDNKSHPKTCCSVLWRQSITLILLIFLATTVDLLLTSNETGVFLRWYRIRNQLKFNFTRPTIMWHSDMRWIAQWLDKSSDRLLLFENVKMFLKDFDLNFKFLLAAFSRRLHAAPQACADDISQRTTCRYLIFTTN